MFEKYFLHFFVFRHTKWKFEYFIVFTEFFPPFLSVHKFYREKMGNWRTVCIKGDLAMFEQVILLMLGKILPAKSRNIHSFLNFHTRSTTVLCLTRTNLPPFLRTCKNLENLHVFANIGIFCGSRVCITVHRWWALHVRLTVLLRRYGSGRYLCTAVTL